VQLVLDPGDRIYLIGFGGNYGSLGLRVRDLHGEGDVLLTAAHVVGSLAEGHDETDRVATLGDQIFGQVLRSVPAVNDDQADPLELEIDASIIKPKWNVRSPRVVDDVDVSGGIYDLSTHDFDAAPIFVKRGATTGVTRGCLVDTAADFHVDTSTRELYYPSGLLIDSMGADLFATSGDSGAIVVAEDGLVLGLVVGVFKPTKADPSPSTFCLPIGPILDALEVDLIGPG